MGALALKIVKKSPLCVDLDGTLIRSDTLFESLALLLKRKPLLAFAVPFWLARGEAHLKARLAAHAPIDPASLPYDPAVLRAVRDEARSGREVYLVSGADQRTVDAVVAHLGFFRGGYGSDGTLNLTGRAKLAFLVKSFGDRGFGYIGNSRLDLPILARAAEGRVANASRAVALKARQLESFAGQLGAAPKSPLRELLRGLRPRQWAKNILVFVPMVAAHRIGSLNTITHGLLAFAAFSACASAVYLLNDILDLSSDRAHPRKRHRPFASGSLPILYGLAAIPALLASSALLSLFLPTAFRAVLVAYFGVTFAYSHGVKKLAMLDVVALSLLYTARLFGGSAACGITLSSWLLGFSLFLFFSLALMKRVSELAVTDGSAARAGRGYVPDDRLQLGVLGSASGLISVLVLALYTHSPEVTLLYHRPQALWLACMALLYWISRAWLLVSRGQIDDDPVVFALTDKASYAVAAFSAAIFIAASLG